MKIRVVVDGIIINGRSPDYCGASCRGLTDIEALDYTFCSIFDRHIVFCSEGYKRCRPCIKNQIKPAGGKRGTKNCVRVASI
jgi:hypothetical protein